MNKKVIGSVFISLMCALLANVGFANQNMSGILSSRGRILPRSFSQMDLTGNVTIDNSGLVNLTMTGSHGENPISIAGRGRLSVPTYKTDPNIRAVRLSLDGKDGADEISGIADMILTSNPKDRTGNLMVTLNLSMAKDKATARIYSFLQGVFTPLDKIEQPDPKKPGKRPLVK